MKKIHFLWSLLTFVMAATMCVGLMSCEDDPELSISKPATHSFNLQSSGVDVKTITVSASDTDWDADVSYIDGSDWLMLGDKDDSSISFTVTDNDTPSPRTAIVTIIATADSKLNKNVTVTQAAGKASVSTSQSSIDFSIDGGTRAIDITCNTSWKLIETDSWLAVAPSSGSGNETISITASENASGQTRNCILTFATTEGDARASVNVTQRGLTGVSAEPTDELLMCYSYAHRVSCGAGTKYFYIALYRQSTFNKMSEAELIADVVTGLVKDRNEPDEDNFYSWNLDENSSYVLAIVPYGQDGRQGKLYTKQVKTKSSDLEPDVDITNFSIDWANDSYVWNVTKNTYCASYYTYAVASKTKFPTFYWMENSSFGLIAWAIRSEMQKDNSNHLTYINQDVWKDWGDREYTAVEKYYAPQVNDGQTTFAANPLSDNYLQIVVWGTKSDGELSGKMHFGYADWSASASSRAIAPLKSPVQSEAKGGKMQFIRGNISDFKIQRISNVFIY